MLHISLTCRPGPGTPIASSEPLRSHRGAFRWVASGLLLFASLLLSACAGSESFTGPAASVGPGGDAFQTAFGDPDYQYIDHPGGLRMLLICGNKPGVSLQQVTELFGPQPDKLLPGVFEVVGGLPSSVCEAISEPGFSIRDAVAELFQ